MTVLVQHINAHVQSIEPTDAADDGLTDALGHAHACVTTGDFESQQSILKWVRTVPGPLQDVIKHQQATCVSDRHLLYSHMSVFD